MSLPRGSSTGGTWLRVEEDKSAVILDALDRAEGLPISEVENGLTRDMPKWKPVTVKALQKAMEGVAIKVGGELEVDMGEAFGLIFDGCSHGSMHYVGLFAVYGVNGQLRDSSQTADGHIKLILAVLGVYNKADVMIRFLVGDNCAANKAIAVEHMVPTGAKHLKVVKLHSHLKKVDNICKCLQRTDLDMAQIRVLFDSVVAEIPVTADYFKAGAAIVHDSDFEAASIKIQQLQAKERKQQGDHYADSLLHSGEQKRKRGQLLTRYDVVVVKISLTLNVETLFSRCKLVPSPQRSSMTTANFEMLVVLKAKSSLGTSLHLSLD
ncbi:hypothetical protein P3T76_012631 [Phytophthora citrophthora]|uniref:Uncharacterized protein n=1 Tax=Phytophthora citrophthora TaxID=4793 RepID=A0AAD9G4R0_9STRA|nr:hypothetical protein P3T76_012631 [Phytophthora citrophthora]